MPRPPDNERRARVVQLRRRRLSFADIGADLGITAQTAHGLYQAALKDTPVLGVEEHRAEQLAIIDDAIQSLRAIADAYPDQAVAAWNAIRGWEERKSRLMGLDAPVKAEMGGKLSYEIIGIDPEQL